MISWVTGLNGDIKIVIVPMLLMLFVIGTNVIVRNLWDKSGKKTKSCKEYALEALYAKGEITIEEFEQMRTDIV
jgi:uncharacterized membrane protein